MTRLRGPPRRPLGQRRPRPEGALYSGQDPQGLGRTETDLAGPRLEQRSAPPRVGGAMSQRGLGRPNLTHPESKGAGFLEATDSFF